MKKLISLILAFVLVLLVASCGKKPYTVLEVGGADSRSVANHDSDIVLKIKSEKDLKLNKNKTFELNSKSYDVEYRDTMKTYFFNGEIDFYESKEVSIGVNKKTGNIDQYSFLGAYVLGTEGTEKSYDECLEIAKKYLGKAVSDVENYAVTNYRYLEIPEYKAVYSFEFARFVNGVKTSDSAFVGVTVYGDVISHTYQNLGGMKDAPVPSEAEMAEIRANVYQKLEDIYGGIKAEYDVEYSTKDVVLSRLEDGKYAIEYYMDAKVTPKAEGKLGFMETNHFLIYVEK
ncbi:MAG: hypothetical protein J6D11_09340 [Clostridia bacterium]|nr:hypothetical protein [Clostridia bacterium]